jgi:ADP-ribosyl-[dinitrogen reductase] hydrolase
MLADRVRAAFLGVAIGDALGATLEFMTPKEIRARFGEHRDLTGGGWLHLKPGQITDDTGMALALARAILSCAGRVEPEACARAFDDWMRARPVDIGNTVRRGIMHYRRTGETCVPYADEAAGNGALMRCLPAAIVSFGAGPEAVAEAWRAQAHVTHHCARSDAAGLFFMQLLHAALAGQDKRSLLHDVAHPFAARHPEFNFRKRRRDNPSGYVVDTLQVVLQAFFDTDTFEECLVDAANRGGDADTTAAIAGMLAGAHAGMAAIPPRWLKQLDPVVRESCIGMADQLVACAAPQQSEAPSC